ncbi:hypothetical protein GGX14DRAFT_556898 [Mycena pura]|uniref:Uncharacterized protein n=1 Tax=Mycena pura TaxID=153505 RepID=A0AAD6YQJ4_9AGAR|nr:hypothetical protein GGX14DRAFT_556898 [Mycena pura]
MHMSHVSLYDSYLIQHDSYLMHVPLRRSRRNQPPETPAAAKVPVKKKKGSGEAVDDSIRTIPKRPRKGKMTENVAPEVPEDAGDSESEPVRKRARSAQIVADSTPEVPEKGDMRVRAPDRKRAQNAKDVAKRNVPSSADADDVPSRQPDGADKGKITTGVTKQDVKDVEHRFHEDEKVQRDVDNEQHDNDDDEDDEDDDDYEQRDDDDDNEQRDDNDHQQGDVDADAQKHKRDVDGEEHANVDDDQQESNAQDKSRPSLFIHEEQESPPSRPVPLRLLWETHQATVHASAGAHRLSDRLFEGVTPKLRHPKLNPEPNPYQVRADLAMQSFNRVLGLDTPSKAVPGLGGKSDNVSLGGSGHARSMLDSGGSGATKVLPKLEFSQIWKPAPRQQQTPRRATGGTVTDSPTQQLTSRPPVPATVTAGQGEDEDDNATGGQQRKVRHTAAKSANERMCQQASDDESSGSDGSDFIETAAKMEKTIAHYNSAVRGTNQELMSIDEEDTMLEDEYLADTLLTPLRTKPSGKVKRGRGARISPRSPSTPARPIQSPPAHDDDDVGEANAADGASEGLDQEDDDDDDSDPPPWHVKSGPLSKQLLQEAKDLQNDYTARLTDLSQRAGVKVSTVLRAIGDVAPAKNRQVNGYNAFLACYAQDHPKPQHMSRKDYKQQYNEAYEALFVDLPEEERTNDDARRSILQPWIDRFIDNRSLVLDDRKGSGRSKALLKKTIDPFIHQSMAAYKNRDHHVWGFAVDLQQDLVNMWGGSQTFEETKKRHALKMTNYMIQMKALMQSTQAELDLKAKGAAQQVAVFIDLSSGGTRRDKARLHLGDLFLNLIQLALMRRGYTLQEAQSAFPRMSWEWANKASKFQLRIVNWPNTLKMFHLGPGFKLAAISDKDKSDTEASRNKALLDMYDALVRVYRGETDADAPNVESWTEDEMDMERPTNVPLVVAADKSELMMSYSSKTLLRTLRTRDGDTEDSRTRKPSQKDKGKGKAVEEQSESPDDDRTHGHRDRVKPRRPQNAGRSDDDDGDGDGDDDGDGDGDGRDASSSRPRPRPRGKARNAGRIDNATDDDSRARARNAKVRDDDGENDEDNRSSRKRHATDEESSRPAKRRNNSKSTATTTGIKCRYAKGDQVSGEFHALRLETSDGELQAEEKETWYLVPPAGWKRLPSGYRPVVAALEEPMRSLRAIEVGYC